MTFINTLINAPCYLLSTFFYLGLSPIAPGTVASLATTCLFYIAVTLCSITLWYNIIIVAIIFVIGCIVSQITSTHHLKDPKFIVIDEVAGQWLTLAIIPHNLTMIIFGFIGFRIFDILKPFPIKSLERISSHRGLNIMLDDIFASFYGVILCSALSFLLSFLLSK